MSPPFFGSSIGLPQVPGAFVKKEFNLRITSPIEASFKVQSYDGNSAESLKVEPDSVGSFKVYVILPKEFLEKGTENRRFINFAVRNLDGLEERVIQANFVY